MRSQLAGVLRAVAQVATLVLAAGMPPAEVAAQSGAWTFPTVLGPGGGPVPAGPPAVAVDLVGGVYAVWIDTSLDPVGPVVAFAERPAGGGWLPATPLEPARAGDQRLDAHVAVDAAGGIHAVWTQLGPAGGDIRYQYRPPFSRVWQPAQSVSGDVVPAHQESARILGDRWGGVHAVWVDVRERIPNIYHRRRSSGGTWSPPVRVNNPPQGDQWRPRLGISLDGWLFAVWTDSRHGAAEIYEARLPHEALDPAYASMVWWPNAALNQTRLSRPQTEPTLVGDGTGGVHAVWVDGGRHLRSAYLPRDAAFWDTDRLIYTAPPGAALAAPVLAASATHLGLAWLQGPPGAMEVFYSPYTPAGLLAPEPASRSPLSFTAFHPSLAIDENATAHLVWLAEHRFGTLDVMHRQRPLPPAAGTAFRAHGNLVYVPRRLSCPGDGYVLVDCDGAMGPYMRVAEVTPGLVGRFVEVTGVLTAEGPCPSVHVGNINLAPHPCPDGLGAATGRVYRTGGPAPGGRVGAGADMMGMTGASGRWLIADLAPGSHVLTATLQCALVAEVRIGVQAGTTTVVPPVEPVLGDVDGDCEVGLTDLVRVTARYREAQPLPACVDLDRDGHVTIYDVATVAGAYGQTCQTPWRPPAPAARTHAPPRTGQSGVLAGEPRDARTESGEVAIRLITNQPVTGAAVSVVLERGIFLGAPRGSDPEAFVVAAESQEDYAHVAIVRPAIVGGFQAGDELARLRLSPGARIRSVDVQLADDRGRAVAGSVALGAQGLQRAYLPAALRR